MKERFIKFLKDEGVRLQFEDSLKNNCGDSIFEHIDQVGEFSYVISAFRWHETNEGRQFWKDIDDKWQKIVEHEGTN